MRRRSEHPAPRTVVPGAIVLALAIAISLSAPSWALGGWKKVPHDSAVFGSVGNAEMFDVASSSPGLVAVGTYSGVNGAAIWLSPDGDTWSRVPDQPDFGLGLMLGVTQGPATMVAVGYLDLPVGDDAAVWTGDGLTWSRVPNDATVFGGTGDQLMHDVCAGGPGFVAVGLDAPDAAVWTSSDGVTWARVPHDDAVLGGQVEVAMYGVVAGGPGFVAVGWDDGDGDRDAAVWTSVDGLAWTRVHHVEAVFGGPSDQTMNAVTVGEDGRLVAVGSDTGIADGGAAVWTSTDGVHWTRVPHVEAVFGGSGFQSMEGVTHGGPGFVAGGKVFYGATTVAAAWISADGIVWEREPHDPAVFGRSDFEEMRAVTVDGLGLVVGVGDAEVSSRFVAAVWTNATWAQASGSVMGPTLPVPTDGPHLIDDPRWYENSLLVIGIVVSVVVVGAASIRLVRNRQSGH